MLEKPQILEVLRSVIDPLTDGSIAASDRVKGLSVKDGTVAFVLDVSGLEPADGEKLKRDVEQQIKSLEGVQKVAIVLTQERRPSASPQEPPKRPPPTGLSPAAIEALKSVGAIIAVASGKGGVGKSTTAVNLACALKEMGNKVGMLDADIYGPSLPTLLNVTEAPGIEDGKIRPAEASGIKFMSIGFMLPDDGPVIWRGPMVAGAIKQLLSDVIWGNLDYLVVDLPPGTGDAQLSLVQSVPLQGAIIVSTPQDLALIDARKGLQMFKKVGTPVLGIVENMSVFVCPSCGEETPIFGHGGAKATAAALGTPFLGEVPLDLKIRVLSDAGTPVVFEEPDGPHAAAYKGIAAAMLDQLKALEARAAG
jgi:ATP-binding protein involved in chromosome partitioning